jgi:hypothetical protein
MKTLLLALVTFSSLSAFASTYNCVARMNKLELKLDKEFTTLIIRDFQSGEYYYNGIVKDIIDRDGRTDLMFETDTYSVIQLQFKSEALLREDEKLFGFVRGHHRGGFLDQSLVCIKKEILL